MYRIGILSNLFHRPLLKSIPLPFQQILITQYLSDEVSTIQDLKTPVVLFVDIVLVLAETSENLQHFLRFILESRSRRSVVIRSVSEPNLVFHPKGRT